MDVRYYVKTAPPKFTIASPGGLYKREGPNGVVASYYGRDGKWHESPDLLRLWFTEDGLGVEEITEEQANAIIRRWKEKWKEEGDEAPPPRARGGGLRR